MLPSSLVALRKCIESGGTLGCALRWICHRGTDFIQLGEEFIKPFSQIRTSIRTSIRSLPQKFNFRAGRRKHRRFRAHLQSLNINTQYTHAVEIFYSVFPFFPNFQDRSFGIFGKSLCAGCFAFGPRAFDKTQSFWIARLCQRSLTMGVPLT